MQDSDATDWSPATPASVAAGGRDLAPGTLVARRFRVIALLGRGGMGEVYRAEDLRLREQVALKLLPAHLTGDPASRARLEEEVRLARRVTHPYVCRVYDVVDADGAVALCMEYIDGEDLASLLRRVGHLPARRALQVARQIVLGVAAIHRQGLLHRDLKPANVMIDGRGAARVTDFGLATEGRDDGFGGTPAYMAPEQLAAGVTSVQSDLWSLALVLHELFSGESPFPPRETLAELRRDRQESTPRPLDVAALGLPEAVAEPLAEALSRCLSRNPADRPRSAAELLAALPGGDPLAEALAAGETPSPEQVASGGPTGHLSATGARWLVAGVALGLATFFAFVDQAGPIGRMHAELSPEVLTDRARAVLAQLGYPQRPAYRSGWFTFEGIELGPVPAASWERWHRQDTGPIAFRYAESVRPIGYEVQRLVGARGVAGEAALLLSPGGRLRRLVVTPDVGPGGSGAAASAAAVDWNALLSAAGISAAALRAVPAVGFVPPMFADQRVAWETGSGEAARRVYAAAYAGRAVFFTLLPASAPAPGVVRRTWTLFDRVDAVGNLGILSVLALGGWLAWRNLRGGRADRRGAARLAVVLAASVGLDAVLMAMLFASERSLLAAFAVSQLQLALVAAVVGAVVYLALEPEVRRRRPGAAVAWTRLLRGRFRDPLVAREVLLGLCCGCALAALWAAEQVVALRADLAWRFWIPFESAPQLQSPLGVVDALVGFLPGLTVGAFLPLLLWVWLLPLLRSPRVAAVVIPLLMVLFGYGTTSAGPTVAATALGLMMAALSLRVGIVAALAALLPWPMLIAGAYTTDPDRFYFANGGMAVVLLGGLALLAFQAAVLRPAAGSLASQPAV